MGRLHSDKGEYVIVRKTRLWLFLALIYALGFAAGWIVCNGALPF